MNTNLNGSGRIKLCPGDFVHDVIREVPINKSCDGIGYIVTSDNGDLLGIAVLLHIPGITAQLSLAGVVEMLLKWDEVVVVPAGLPQLVT